MLEPTAFILVIGAVAAAIAFAFVVYLIVAVLRLAVWIIKLPFKAVGGVVRLCSTPKCLNRLCGAAISRRANFCARCGRPVERRQACGIHPVHARHAVRCG